MANFLTVKGEISCPHGGKAPVAMLVRKQKFFIDSVNVLTEENVGSLAFSCPSTTPCVSVGSWIPGQIKIKINGIYILTDLSLPVTNNGPGRVTNAGQEKVKIEP